jgi:succinoglycan biosynthesis transport protein ExoP
MEPENEGQNAGISLQEYWIILRRRRTILLQIFFAVAIVGTTVTLITPRTYQAIAQLEVDPPAASVGTIDNGDNPLSALFQPENTQSVETQVQVLQAAPLLNQVLMAVGRANIDVEQVKDTNIISVTAEAGNAQVAANAANALLDDYIAQLKDHDLGDVQTALAFVERQETDASLNLDDAEQQLRAFRSANHVDEIADSRSALLDRISNLDTQLETAESTLAGTRAQLATSLSLYDNESPEQLIKIHQSNPAIADLQNKISALQIQRTTLLQPGGYTATSTVIRGINSQIAALKRQMAALPPLTQTYSGTANSAKDALLLQINSLKSQVPSLQSQVTELSAELSAANEKLSAFPNLEVTMSKLLRQRDDAERSVEMFSTNLNDLNLREKAYHASVNIIQKAIPPVAPIRPNRILNIFVSLLAGLIIGASVALLQEYIDDRINSTEDAERLLSLPSLGRVPQLTADDARLLPQMKGLDPETESYRILRTNIHFASVDKPLRTLQVTSAGPGEGKTTTAANLAFAMAMDGKKVILIDTDLRRPSVHKLLGLRQVPGITDLLLGTATLSEAMRPHETLPEMSIIPAGITPPNPSELLNSQKFKTLVEQLSMLADIVILDSPPVLAASDAQIIASKVDGVIVVVANGETRKASARQAMKILRQARANVIGIAYNKTNIQESYYYYHYHYSTPTLGKDEDGNDGRHLLTNVEDDNIVSTK